MHRPLACVLWLAALVGVCLAGCGERNAYQPPAAPRVTSEPPVERQVEDWLVFTGVTRAEKTVELRSRVRGYLKEIHFADGDIVEKDELLFVIDPEPFEAERDAAQASLDKAAAALALAETNLKRTVRLSSNNAISEQQLDIDRAELATAEANVKTAKANLKQANLNLGYTEIRAPMTGMIGRHLVDQGNLVLPDQSLLAVIESTAPIHAYFNVSERDLLRAETLRASVPPPSPTEQSLAVSPPPRPAPAAADDSAAALEAGGDIADPDVARFVAAGNGDNGAGGNGAADREAQSLETQPREAQPPAAGGAPAPERSRDSEKGLPVVMALGDSGEFAFHGRVDFRELGIDPETGTTLRRAEFPNADRQLVPGMFVRVRVSLGAPRSRLLVQQQALGADQLGDYVLVVGKDKIVERRSVALGPRVGDLRVVDGISPGESIIVQGLQRARPGSEVNDGGDEDNEPPAAASAARKSGEPSPAAVTAARGAAPAEGD